LATVRSHDQWNTTIYSGNDRYRGIRNLRTLIFMNRHDMRDRDIKSSATSTSWPPPATAAPARCTGY
jgi:anaerobic selenocysteine-containing dehydrogenase